MAGSLNKVTLIGNVGREPEIRSDQKGRKIASFSVATSETWKDKMSGERKEKTEWHRVVIFTEGLVSVVESYVQKGTKVYVEGSLQTRKWVDKSGIERHTTEVVLQNYSGILMLLSSKNGSEIGSQDYNRDGEMQTPDYVGSRSYATSSSNHSSSAVEEELEDEIPF